MTYQVQVNSTNLKKIVDEVIRPNISTQERQTLLHQIGKFDEMNNQFFDIYKDIDSSTGLKLVEGKYEFSSGDVKIVIEKSANASHIQQTGKPRFKWNRYVFTAETNNGDMFEILSKYFTCG
jgi:hypothetical protein